MIDDESYMLVGYHEMRQDDDVKRLCEECGNTIYLRPHASRDAEQCRCRIVCPGCAEKILKSVQEAEIFFTPETRQELLDKGHTLGEIDEKLNDIRRQLRGQRRQNLDGN